MLKFPQYLQENTYVERGLQHRWFPVNIANILGKSILKKICERLLKRIFPLNLLEKLTRNHAIYNSIFLFTIGFFPLSIWFFFGKQSSKSARLFKGLYVQTTFYEHITNYIRILLRQQFTLLFLKNREK